MDDLNITSTSTAKEHASSLASAVTSYKAVIEEMQSVYDSIKTNWQGDAEGLNSLLESLASCISNSNTDIGGMDMLASTVPACCDAFENVSNVEVGSETVVETPTFHSGAGRGFENWGTDFLSNWNGVFSSEGKDSAIDYVVDFVGAAANSAIDVGEGAIDLVGAAGEWLVDGAVGLIEWIF